MNEMYYRIDNCLMLQFSIALRSQQMRNKKLNGLICNKYHRWSKIYLFYKIGHLENNERGK